MLEQKARRKEYDKKYRLAHLDKERERVRRYYDAHKKEIAAQKRVLRYGLSQVEFERLFTVQDGGCAICGKKEWSIKPPQIDHNHKTGKVRGILCYKCNIACGLLDEDVERVQGLLEYLKKFR